MNALLWTLQLLCALIYSASGVMKIFMFERISVDVPSFGALPRPMWTALGVIELACVLGLVAPLARIGPPSLPVIAGAVLAAESVVFIWVHVQYGELPPIVMSAILGVAMAFVAYGRSYLRPL